MKINFVGGNGIMGKVHVPIFEKYGHEVIITGRSSDKTIEEACKEADLTIVCVPIHHTKEIIKKVAPISKAIIDFTGLKEMPVKTMLENCSENCEVASLHPMYGNVESIKGKNIILIRTEKTGKKCEELFQCFEKQGANLIELSARDHDRVVSGLSQNARLALLEAYGLLLEQYGIQADDLYELSSPPTRLLLTALARQCDETIFNDEVYEDMRNLNPHSENLINELKEILDLTKKQSKENREKIRKNFKNIKKYQDKAKKLIEDLKD